MSREIDALKQFRLALLVLVALTVVGTFGYHELENMPVLDALLVTVSTLGTLNLSQPTDTAGKVFAICLIVFGVTAVFWAGASLIQTLVSEQMWHALQNRKMQKQIAKMRDHFIVCGYGRMGQQIVKDLQREGTDHCVIEWNPEQLPKLVAQDIPFVEGNASDDKALKAAGIEHAKGLITVAPTDEDNVFITLSARALNPKLFIAARSIQEDNEGKLRMAGADKVMSPYVMGGKRMATAALRPNVQDFVELAMHTDDFKMMIEELVVGPGSKLIDQSIGNCGLKKATGVTIIAIKRTSGKIIPNPTSAELLHEGDVLIVIGVPKQMDKALKLTCPKA
ncbi:MAG: TrkA family potassium uptake protein [Armatimonadetes bacterium]|nr:TrkA family potassium uptake protein [Armatimonadota bacterium]